MRIKVTRKDINKAKHKNNAWSADQIAMCRYLKEHVYGSLVKPLGACGYRLDVFGCTNEGRGEFWQKSIPLTTQPTKNLYDEPFTFKVDIPSEFLKSETDSTKKEEK